MMITTDFFGFLIGALATYRLARFLTRDEIFSPVRNLIWKKFKPEKGGLGYLFTCMWCMSVWTASIVVLSSIIMPKVTLYICIVLGLSAVAGLLAAYEDRD